MPRPQFTRKHPPPDPAILKQIRESMGLSMPKIAELLEVGTASWENWEYGKNPMPAPVFQLLKIHANGKIKND
jgi:DNA-binding transcriptional regulator YiaG